jgi:REP element-mobilizing transposase RayT
MTIPRSQLVCIDDTPYYHITTRCVRRAFLCGTDPYSGQCFEHRRQWIADRIGYLQSVFAIDIAAYAVMSNHCHIVLKLQSTEYVDWSDVEIVDRWDSLFSVPSIIKSWIAGNEPSLAIEDYAKTLIQKWKSRLCSLSWFMRCLNESIARRANTEDNCTGRFWEGRYKTQALLDERALLTCMAYVDLNPIRAGISNTPESSDYTSIQQRICEDQPQKNKQPNVIDLIPFNPTNPDHHLPMDLHDYLELVDWTGRAIALNKKGSIPEHLPKILNRLGIEEDNWINTMTTYSTGFKRVVGPLDKIQSLCDRLQQKWMGGIQANRLLYPT